MISLDELKGRGQAKPIKARRGSKAIEARGASPKSRAAMKTAALAKTPQAVVKVIGYTTKQSSIKRQVKYISRDGTEPLENEFGEKIEGSNVDKRVLEDWEGKIEEGIAKNGKPSRLSMHLQVSAPPGTDQEKFKAIVEEWGAKAFEGRRYVYAVHDDRRHPHAHFLVALAGEDGKKLDPRKKDLQAWREQFAEIATAKGVPMAATRWHEHRKDRPPKEASNSASYRIASRGEVSGKSISELRRAITESPSKKDSPALQAGREEHRRLAVGYRRDGKAGLAELHERAAAEPRQGRLESLRDAVGRGDPAISKRMKVLAEVIAKEKGLSGPKPDASFAEVREFLNEHARRQIPVRDGTAERGVPTKDRGEDKER